MSRYGIQAGGETIFSIKNPLKALDLIYAIVKQWNGAMWTQHKPRCPLCNDELQDCERHMNQPVGECANKKCESRVYAADYFGKIKDVMEEWLAEQSDWVDEMEKKVEQTSPSFTRNKPELRQAHKRLNVNDASLGSLKDLADIDEEEIFIW